VQPVHATYRGKCLLLGTQEDPQSQPDGARVTPPRIVVIRPAVLEGGRYHGMDRLQEKSAEAAHHHAAMTEHLPSRTVRRQETRDRGQPVSSSRCVADLHLVVPPRDPFIRWELTALDEARCPILPKDRIFLREGGVLVPASAILVGTGLLSRSFRYKTFVLTLPYLYRHLVMHRLRQAPAARSVTEKTSSRELRRAAHDIYCEMLLNGYRDCTGLPVVPDTGLALVLFMAFMFVFDLEFENCRHSPRAQHFDAVRQSPQVEALWLAYVTYCRSLPRGSAAVDLVEERFEAHYHTFLERERMARGARDLHSTVELVELDSGLTVVTVYDIIRSLNGHGHNVECREQFRAVGMAGKFLDDIRDVAEDVHADLPNLFYASTAPHSVERHALTRAIRRHQTLSMGWLASNCPSSYGRFMDLTISYYRGVRTPLLRLPLDIIWALLGTSRYWSRPIRRAPEAI
jgi:hypothetical protein